MEPKESAGRESGAKIWIDDVEHVVDVLELSGKQLKELAGKNGGARLFLAQAETRDLAIADDEIVQINGGEQFRTTKIRKAYQIYIDEVEYVVETEKMTGTQIKQLAGKPADYTLFLERPGQPDKQIRDDEVVHIKEGEHFHTVPPANFG
ncbi:MAG: multiubiquitin domain-containing protein [Candidatus Eremiobacteraeota bacterium]|nr:multiubiquitin domain-containing protein [Candidatus Eremiobacteraeota bacterium]